MTLRYIEPGTSEYARAADLRYEALYEDLGLPRDLIADVDGRAYHHLAAFDGDRLVGYARLHLEYGESKIYQVCVARDRQGEGIATLMMGEMMRLAAEEGRSEILLDAREHVISFYQKLGFATEGEMFLSPRTNTPHKAMRRALPPLSSG